MAGIESVAWRSLDFSSSSARVSSTRGALLIKREDCDDVRVPLADVAVILFGVKTSISGGVMHHCFENDVSVVFCDWKGVPLGAAMPWSEHSRVAARQRAQASATLPQVKQAWANIVSAKIRGQAEVLKQIGSPVEKQLIRLVKEVKSGDSSNCEAQAAKLYWDALFGHLDFRRKPGVISACSPNDLLDYGYTILRGHAMRAVVSAGLSPALGVFHKGRSNNFCLADDLIEPFRPLIDLKVATELVGADIEDAKVRKALVETAGQVFGCVENSIPAEMTALAQRLGMFFERNVSNLVVKHWKPKRV
ncbi:MAG: type II CRISPR-associated endonuclease Cas1 [Arcanobacterium sp.]|nr:type II CRISPR-associated endonuclease Cas1 [Arcanobacterium sp.]